jgi:hypothetical protein
MDVKSLILWLSGYIWENLGNLLWVIFAGLIVSLIFAAGWIYQEQGGFDEGFEIAEFNPPGIEGSLGGEVKRVVGLVITRNGPKPMKAHADIVDIVLEKAKLSGQVYNQPMPEIVRRGRLLWSGPATPNSNGKMEIGSKGGKGYLAIGISIKDEGNFLALNVNSREKIDMNFTYVLRIRIIGAINGNELPARYFTGRLDHGLSKLSISFHEIKT